MRHLGEIYATWDASTESDPIYPVAYNIIRAAYIDILICYTKDKTNCNRGIKQG